MAVRVAQPMGQILGTVNTAVGLSHLNVSICVHFCDIYVL